jgi:hypothetical protein
MDNLNLETDLERSELSGPARRRSDSVAGPDQCIISLAVQVTQAVSATACSHWQGSLRLRVPPEADELEYLNHCDRASHGD